MNPGSDDLDSDDGAPAGFSVQEVLDIAKRVMVRIREDHVSLASAGVAFYAFLALVPALAAVISVYGLVADADKAGSQIQNMFSSLPPQTSSLLTEQVNSIVASSSGALSLTLVISIALSLWAASSGVSHLVEATNLVYRETDARKFLARRGLALALTIGFAVIGAIALFLLTKVIPALADPLPSNISWLVTLIGWLIVAALYVVGLGVLYRVGPDREAPAWHWFTPGALLAVVVFVAASLAFSFYVSNFGSYNETYGSLAAVVILLLWLFISSFVILLAGEINAEVEQHTFHRETADAP